MVNNTIKAVLNQRDIARAARYSSHALRRWGSSELKTKGPKWPSFANSCEWRLLGCRGYIDLTDELDRAISNLLDEKGELDSDPEADVMSSGAGPTYRD